MVKEKEKPIIHPFEETSGLFRLYRGRANDLNRFASDEQKLLLDQMTFYEQASARSGFARSDYGDVRAFFEEASIDYDSDLVNPYWSFTHEVLRYLLALHIKQHFDASSQLRLFDAGAGTGNWSKFILGLGLNVRAILFDMNPCMLRFAHPKMSSIEGSSVRFVEGDLEDLDLYPQDRSNLILCMHNVIGLGRDSSKILANLCSYLEIGGMAFIMAMNKFHAFNFARQYRSDREIARVVRDDTVKFKDDMPEMFCYTPSEFQKILLEAGFDEVKVLGFPVTVYPSVQDTKLLRRDTNLSHLKDPMMRNRLLEVEKRLCLNPELAYRGASSLIAICKKYDEKTR